MEIRKIPFMSKFPPPQNPPVNCPRYPKEGPLFSLNVDSNAT